MLEKHRAELESVAQEVRATRARHRNYLPPSLREAGGRVERRLHSDGVPKSAISQELGVNAMTLSRYMELTTEKAEPRRDFVAVTIAEPPEKTSLTFVSPSGWRIEELDITTAVELLKALS